MQELSPSGIAILEDDFFQAEGIKLSLREMGFKVAGTFDTGEGLLAYLRDASVKPYLVLVDISLAGRLSGIDVANKLSGEFKLPFIYLTSNTDPDFFEAIVNSEPSGILIKPYDNNELQLTIRLVEQKQSLQNSESKEIETPAEISDIVFLKTSTAYKKVDFSEVLWVESSGNYTIVHKRNEEYTVSQNLTEFNEKLQHPAFIRVHRSYLVNINFVDAIQAKQVIVAGQEIPLSRSGRSNLKQVLKMI